MAWKHVYGEQHLKRGLYINKILYGVIDLPLWVFNPIANSPCRTRGRARDALVADPNLLTFFTRPTPNRPVGRLSRAWPCRAGEPEGSGPRVSPSRYKEVILLLQQTLAGERRPTTGDPKTGRRRQGGRPKSRPRPAGSHPAPNSTAAQPRGNIPTGRRQEDGPSRRRRACTLHMAPPRSPTGQTKALPTEGSPPPKEGSHPLHGRRSRVVPQMRGRRHSSRPATSRQGARAPKKGGTVGQPSVWGRAEASLSSPPVVSQSAGRSHRRRSRRAPRPLKKSARARLAAEGKLGPPTPAVGIRG